ncbi:cyclic pyranopterin monophosphate synthase MoaC [Candidatus Pacearchaeota archaeon]|nr:MAG: cyclic pyranopterin monophosphate synthase MoaC [Candidatus Pacearchaeota archaeon]
MKFAHLNKNGKLQMVDIGSKPFTYRKAVAKAEVVFPEEIYEKIISNDVPKGDILTCAKVAGILGAKKTPELIPLCHPLPLSKIDLNFNYIPERFSIEITGEIHTTAQTGVEMEALTAVSIAALAIYDMCKSLHKGIRIENIRLIYKSGGKSGEIYLE